MDTESENSRPGAYRIHRHTVVHTSDERPVDDLLDETSFHAFSAEQSLATETPIAAEVVDNDQVVATRVAEIEADLKARKKEGVLMQKLTRSICMLGCILCVLVLCGAIVAVVLFKDSSPEELSPTISPSGPENSIAFVGLIPFTVQLTMTEDNQVSLFDLSSTITDWMNKELAFRTEEAFPFEDGYQSFVNVALNQGSNRLLRVAVQNNPCSDKSRNLEISDNGNDLTDDGWMFTTKLDGVALFTSLQSQRKIPIEDVSRLQQAMFQDTSAIRFLRDSITLNLEGFIHLTIDLDGIDDIPESPNGPLPTPPPDDSPKPKNTKEVHCFTSDEDLFNAVRMYYNEATRPSTRVYGATIGDWCVGQVQNMEDLFRELISFNEPIGNWDVSRVTSMRRMFSSGSYDEGHAFNQDISKWNVSSVTNMRAMFYNCNQFNQDISAWTVSSVTNMIGMFQATGVFNQNLSAWDVSSVTSMERLFYGSTAFNGDISGWDVSMVTDMSFMFGNTPVFDQPLTLWNTSSVKSMMSMFQVAPTFNQNLLLWDVSSVTSMHGMFIEASAFNHDISEWNVSAVVDMRAMFFNASSYNQNLCAWQANEAALRRDMFGGTSCGSTRSEKDHWCDICS